MGGWEKFGLWSGLASIIGIPLTIFLFSISSSPTIITNIVETKIGKINLMQKEQAVSMPRIAEGLNNNTYCNKKEKYCMKVAAANRWYIVKAVRDINGSSIIAVPHGTVTDDKSFQFITDDASVVFFSKETIKGMKLSLWIFVETSYSKYLDDLLIEEIYKNNQFGGVYAVLLISLIDTHPEVNFSKNTNMGSHLD